MLTIIRAIRFVIILVLFTIAIPLVVAYTALLDVIEFQGDFRRTRKEMEDIPVVYGVLLRTAAA